MKEKIQVLKEKFHNSKYNLPVRFILLAIVVNLVVEMLSRRSILEGLLFAVTNPLCFLYGAMLVLFTLAFSVLVHRKVFTITFICGLWLVGGVVNFVVTEFRHTPFTAQDFKLMKYAVKVAPVYLSAFQIVIIAVLAVLFISGMAVWWVKAPKYKEKINYFKALVVVLSFWFVVWGSTRIGLSVGVLARNFGNIGTAYDEYGFAYCFSNSLLNSGIDKPKEYNEDTINEILQKIDRLESENAQNGGQKQTGADRGEDENSSAGGPESENSASGSASNGNSGNGSIADGSASNENLENGSSGNESFSDEGTEDKAALSGGSDEKGGSGNGMGEQEDNEPTREYPNIIFLQLESLFDPQLLEDVEFTETVLPTLERLYHYYPTGFLSVPSVGAGTANTEFEVISGMNLDDFGPGEYPYKTVLSHSACESICFDLKKYGYTTNAIHNNDGTFYDRNSVFSQLGFDTFTSIEYMNDIEYNEIGWADDSILTSQIMEVLNSSERRDFIYTISVQGHGDYPSDYEIKSTDIRAEGETIEAYEGQFTYYINQIHQMDEFVRELITALKANAEPVVLVIYGDHLPAFDIADEDLGGGNTYTTEYVVWNNIGLKKTNEDVEAFQLASHVLDMLEIGGGAISKYHSSLRNSEDYEEYLAGLRVLEYDILYGDREIYGGKLPYSQTNLQMGHKSISIKNVSNADNHFIVSGENFTRFSHVLVNNEYVDTIYSSDEILLVDGITLKSGDSVAVVQKGKDGIKLSSTSLFIFR